MTAPEETTQDGEKRLPFADSLCHRCGAPPRYVRTERTTFIRCPILNRYPPQPVRSCEAFVPREGEGQGGCGTSA